MTPGRSSRTRRGRRCSGPTPRGFVDALLGDDELELAWSAAAAAPRDALGSDLWLRLAERSERDRPADALAVYQRIADEVLERADRRAYRSAARILQRARAAAQAAGELDAFAEYLTGLRERYRRRPTLIAILDKAGLSLNGAVPAGQRRARRGVACSHQSGSSPCSRSHSSVLAVEYTCAPPPVQKLHSFCVARL